MRQEEFFKMNNANFRGKKHTSRVCIYQRRVFLSKETKMIEFIGVADKERETRLRKKFIKD